MKQKITYSFMFVLFFCMAAVLLYIVVENPEATNQIRLESSIQTSLATFAEPISESALNGFIDEVDICGADDRIGSSDPAVGRIRIGTEEIACTGWIVDNGLLITAGHCIESILNDGIESSIEFNVKASESNGDLVDSEPEDVYIIDEAAIQSSDWINDDGIIGGGINPDWGVFRVENNQITGLQPIMAQNAFYEIEIPNTSLPSTMLRVTGYGIDAGENNPSDQPD